jgi:hypothetical protein
MLIIKINLPGIGNLVRDRRLQNERKNLVWPCVGGDEDTNNYAVVISDLDLEIVFCGPAGNDGLFYSSLMMHDHPKK